MKNLRNILILAIVLAIVFAGARLWLISAFDSLFSTREWYITEVSEEQRCAALLYTKLNDFDYIKVESIYAYLPWSASDASIGIIISIDKSNTEQFTPIAEKAGYVILSDSAAGRQNYEFIEFSIGAAESIRKVVGDEAYSNPSPRGSLTRS